MYPRSSSALSVASSSSSLPAPFVLAAPLPPALGLRGGAGAAGVDADEEEEKEEEEDEVDGVLAAASAAALPAFSVAACVCGRGCVYVDGLRGWVPSTNPVSSRRGNMTRPIMLHARTFAAAALALAAMSAKVLLLGSSCRPFSKAATAASNSLRALWAWPLR